MVKGRWARGSHPFHKLIGRTRLLQPWELFASWAGLAALGRMPKEGCIMYPMHEVSPTIAAGAGCKAFRSAFDDPEADERDECEGSVVESGTAFPLLPEDEGPAW